MLGAHVRHGKHIRGAPLQDLHGRQFTGNRPMIQKRGLTVVYANFP
jgi:hypothetical protein